MSKILFVALAKRTEPAGYHASFPDLPECTADGADLAELLVNARATLVSRLNELANAGESWPQPSPFEALTTEPGMIPIPVDVSVDDPPVRVNISLGERLVGRLDAAAEARGMTRSGFIAQAVRISLGERGATADFDAATRRLQDELRTLGRKINDSIGPDSAFSRRMAELDDQVVEGVRKAADSVSAAMARRREASQSARPASPSET